MNKYGMFKAVVCDERTEYSFPAGRGNERIIGGIFLFLLVFSIFSFMEFTPDIVKIFISPTEINISIKDNIDDYGISKLHRAVIKGNMRVFKILIKNKFDINRSDNYGWTALHWAKFLSRSEFIKILLDNGARKDLRTTKDWFVYKKGSLPEDIKCL